MRRNKKGFSLLETIIYVLLMGVIFSAIALFLLHITIARAKTNVISEVLSAAHLIEERLSEAIRHADSIRVADSIFGTDPGVLSLNMVDASREPTVFSLSADNGQFQVAEAGGATFALTPSNVQVTNLVFTNLTGTNDVGIIQVQFTLEITSSSGAKPFHYDQAFQTTLRIPLD